MRLKLTNKTHYDSLDLRRLISAGLRALGDERRYFVSVVYGGRGSSTSGYAYYNSGTIRLRVPRGYTVNDERKPRSVVYEALPLATVRDLAHTLAHEIAHTNGVRHSEMDAGLKRCHHGGTDDAPTPWADGLEIRAKAEKPKPEVDLVSERARHAGEMLVRWERRVKAATTKMKSWRRKVAYYEKKAAAKGGA